MNLRKELKKLLGNKYSYCRFISEIEKERIKNIVVRPNSEYLISRIIAGYIKIECTMMCGREDKCYYDIFVKDTPNAKEWICYQSVVCEGDANEELLLKVMDKVVKENGLSYTECSFEVLAGKEIQDSK